MKYWANQFNSFIFVCFGNETHNEQVVNWSNGHEKTKKNITATLVIFMIIILYIFSIVVVQRNKWEKNLF